MKNPRKPNLTVKLTAKDFKDATGSDRELLNVALVRQTIDALWLPESLEQDERLKRIHAAVAMLQGIKPADELEGMLATQMVATHSAAMDCLRRAMIEGQMFGAREQNLKHASKLLSIYARQLDVLNKHRGKGQQTVRVEHVHIEAGAQAVVGNIVTRKRVPDPSMATPATISHQTAEQLNFDSDDRRASKVALTKQGDAVKKES